MYNEYCRLHWGVGWTDLALLRFLKMDTFLAITYIFLSSIPKNQQIWPHLHAAHARKSFNFEKSHEPKTEYVIENVQRTILSKKN